MKTTIHVFMKQTVIGFGELLWDMLPAGKQIGGAPGNFAFHAMQCGLDGYIVSAVGNDPLGDEILQVARERGLNCIVSRVDKPTGTVDIKLDSNGVPQYTINEHVAWDYIPFTPQLQALARQADAVCFGSLAQRHDISRNTLHRFLSMMKKDTLKIFDVNLRQHFYDRSILEDNLNVCNILKLNDEEVAILGRLFGYESTNREAISRQLLTDFSLKMVILTCGSECSYVFTPDGMSHIDTPKGKIADTVGAGDSFTATFCACIMQGDPISKAHQAAVDVAAYVCTQNGAMPVWPAELRDTVSE